MRMSNYEGRTIGTQPVCIIIGGGLITPSVAGGYN